MITIAKPAIGSEEKAAVLKVMDSGMIASGLVVNEFQNNFARYVGTKYGVATTSGTTALEVAIRSLGITRGDKVITTPFSFIASTNAIVYVGAEPIFADIDPNTYNLTPEGINSAIEMNPDAKAVLIVHLFGQSCNMDEIVSVVKQKNILLIEDCAQAHGAMWNGKKVGGFGDVAAFSFYPTKNMATGEGGMVTTNRVDVAEKAQMYVNHGMKVRYHHDVVGYNYRMTNIAAAIGIEQLKKLDGFNDERIRHAELYKRFIRNPLVVIPGSPKETHHVYHQYSVRVKNRKRDDLIKLFEKNGIGYGVFYPLTIPEQACYNQFNFKKVWANADLVKEEILSIPVHPLLSDDDIKTVSDVINKLE
jgi:perosamine synthetase